jgi:hypothetical protein
MARIARTRRTCVRSGSRSENFPVSLRKLLFVLVLASSPVRAEWTPVAGDDGARFSTYADLATIRKRDSMVTMWTMVDFKNAQRAPYGPEYLSLRAQQEFDCNGARTRVLYFEQHSGQMGDEDVVATHAGPDEWKPVPPESNVEALWKIACK